MELRTIVDFTRYNPSIDPTAFPNTSAEPFWTSSPYARELGAVWSVYFDVGYPYLNGAGDSNRVRCVR